MVRVSENGLRGVYETNLELSRIEEEDLYPAENGTMSLAYSKVKTSDEATVGATYQHELKKTPNQRTRAIQLTG